MADLTATTVVLNAGFELARHILRGARDGFRMTDITDHLAPGPLREALVEADRHAAAVDDELADLDRAEWLQLAGQVIAQTQTLVTRG